MVKNENSHIVEKERYDFEDSATGCNPRGVAPVQLSGFWVVLSASCLVMVLAASMVLAAGDTVDTAEAGLIDVVSQKVIDGETAVVALVQENSKQSSMLTSPSTAPKSCGMATVVSRNQSSSTRIKEDTLQPGTCTNEG